MKKIINLLGALIGKSENVKDIDGVKIGRQEWSVKNLDVTKFRSGEIIPEAKNTDAWNDAIDKQKPAWCHYEYNSSNGNIYGKLYNYYTINDSRGLAPKGWHIPSDEEWTELSSFLGGDNEAGFKMKNTTGWNNNGNGNNKSGLACLPGGILSTDQTFVNIGKIGIWWSTSKSIVPDSYWVRALAFMDNKFQRIFGIKKVAYSVRCLKD